MRWAHLFNDMFGLSALDWFDDRFTYGDFLWMRAQAQQRLNDEKKAEEASRRGR